MIGTYLGMSQNGGAQECPKPLFFSVQNKALGHSFFETSPFTKSEKHKWLSAKNLLSELHVEKGIYIGFLKFRCWELVILRTQNLT